MNEPGLGPSYELEAGFDKKLELARFLGVAPEDVYDANMEAGAGMRGGPMRYEYCFVTPPRGLEAFVKIAIEPDPALNTSLAREVTAIEIAKRLGIPCKKVLSVKNGEEVPYGEIEGKGVIALELLDAKDWDFLATPEQLTRLNDEQSKRLIDAATKSIINFSGAEVPADIDTSTLRQGQTADWRYRSPEHIDKVWAEGVRVIDQLETVFPDDTEQQRHRLTELVQDAKARITHLIAVGETGKQYLVHGDFDPYNICLPKNREIDQGALILDFEHAGKTEYQALAKFSDLSNFLGRMWPNPQLQQSFIRSYFRAESELQSVEASYHLMRSAIIFSTIYLAKYGMAPDHPEHSMSVALLENLESNLRTLDAEYQSSLEKHDLLATQESLTMHSLSQK